MFQQYQPPDGVQILAALHFISNSYFWCSWAAYVAGALLVLMHELQHVFTRGLSLLVSSDVPDGKGVSSSAALEVSAMSAIAAAYQLEIEPSRLAELCQKVCFLYP